MREEGSEGKLHGRLGGKFRQESGKKMKNLQHTAGVERRARKRGVLSFVNNGKLNELLTNIPL